MYFSMFSHIAVATSTRNSDNELSTDLWQQSTLAGDILLLATDLLCVVCWSFKNISVANRVDPDQAPPH